jgi:hypothetical protein
VVTVNAIGFVYKPEVPFQGRLFFSNSAVLTSFRIGKDFGYDSSHIQIAVDIVIENMLIAQSLDSPNRTPPPCQ